MSISLKVEIIPGEDIKSACKSMCALSEKLNIMIESDFNGVQLIATTATSPENLESFYYSEMGNKR